MHQLPVLQRTSPENQRQAPLAPIERDAELARKLVNAVEGEVRLDAHDRMLYATDASLYQVEPLAVVVPASVEDVVSAVRFCSDHGLPMLPRGGGTSLAGQCTNRAVVMDLSANCRDVLAVDVPGKRCRVEPGITVDDLNDVLAGMSGGASGLFFAPDPATSRHANIGGCIGNNAAGARSIRYGRTSENLNGVDVCTADGVRLRLDRGAALRDTRVREITQRVCEIVSEFASLIRERFPKTVRRNAGYGLDMILFQMERAGWRDGLPVDDAVLAEVNLAHLVCGSEGTLAVTLGAELTLHERPKAKGLAVLGFESVEAAIDSVLAILRTNPTAVELLDDTVIDLARANTEYRRYVDLMPQPDHGTLKAVLYVEYFGENAGEIQVGFAGLRSAAPGVPMQAHTDAVAMLSAWKLRKAGEPLLHGIPGHRKPITFIEDNAIPVENLATFVRELKKIVAAHGTMAAFYAHASVGVLHVRPLVDIHDPGDREIMRSIAVQTADLARSLGGVMSGEHGDGRVRTPLLERFYGSELMEAFRRVKRVFDPRNLLNPGNIVDVSGADPRPIESMTQNLRVGDSISKESVSWMPDSETYFEYADQHGFDGAVEMCNGAGVCRKKQGGTMCPSYQATMDERHSTRGRGNALRLAITGQVGVKEGAVARGAPVWNDAGAMETLSLCLSCKACKTECPSNVDISRLKAEYTGQRYAREGAPLSAKLLGNVRALSRLGAMFPGAANAVAKTGWVRAVMNRVLGFHENRTLPEFARALPRWWSFDDRVEPSHDAAHKASKRVVLFGDCFSMFNEPEIGLAVRRVLRACGYEVELADAGCCGRPKISLGLLPEAISEADETLERLRPAIEDDNVVAILVAEPSCLSAFKDDWRQLKLKSPRALRERLAKKSFLPEEFVEKFWQSHPKQPVFRTADGDRQVLLHGHCHQKALWGTETSAALLRRVLGNGVRVLDTGCCGMAGSFGYAKERYALSMKIGEMTLFPAVRSSRHATVCAPGTSCRHQVHDGTGERAIHPIELVASMLEE